MAVKQYKTPMGSKTVVGRALLGVMHSNCDGNRMFQAEVLFRTKKVKQECCVSFYVAGQNTCLMRACILSQDKRSDAPRDGYSAWLTIKLPGGMQVLEAKRALQAAKEWHGLLEQQRLGQICFASVNIACGKLLGHLVNDTNMFILLGVFSMAVTTVWTTTCWSPMVSGASTTQLSASCL